MAKMKQLAVNQKATTIIVYKVLKVSVIVLTLRRLKLEYINIVKPTTIVHKHTAHLRFGAHNMS